MSVRGRWWWIAGAVIFVTTVIAAAVAPESQIADVFFIIFLLWAIASVWVAAWWMWRRMTYRVGVRLFITYFLIGVLPLLFAAAFGGVGLYVLMGQYTSVRLGSELRRVRWELVHQCDTILQRAELQGTEAAVSLLEELAAASHEPLPRVAWQARFGDRMVGLQGGEDLPEMVWLAGEERRLTVRHGDRAFGVASAVSDSGDRVTALIPLDDVSADAISGAWWFDVAFFIQNGGDEGEESENGGDGIQISTKALGSISFTLASEDTSGNEIWPAWPESNTGLLSRPAVVWFRVAVGVVDLESGQPLEDANLVALLRTSPRNVWDDFTVSRYELGRELWGVLAGLGVLFLVGYGLALTAAATVVMSIARSTSRLTQGALQVEQGNLDHRVPVKRRDQLGDLARSFNHMTDSVQSMLADVAEKERLAHELELARQIQESLLPARYLEVGPVTVRATFRPATEVGGDYFDVFPLSEDRLVVAIGDVAGHGLSTGLLMASLKSSVAALVHEGYEGSDLIDKVNHLLLEHGQGRTLVTLTVVEIDFGEGRLSLANAGHCPPFLVRPEGRLEELMAGSFPMGSRLCRPATLEKPFPVASRLVLYSDGLVEAVSPDGEPFGYERLQEIVGDTADQSSTDLTAMILDALAKHADGTPAADDLTVLIVERN